MDPETLVAQGATDWNAADVDVPNLTRDTTPEFTEQLIVDAKNIPPDEFGNVPCATTGPVAYTSPTAGTGVNELIQHIMTFNTDTNLVRFGRSPVGGTENCPVENTIRHELGHFYGLMHTPMNGALMQPVAQDVTDSPLPMEAVSNTRAIYGYSGSTTSYAIGTKFDTSNLVKPAAGQSVAVVHVLSKGAVRVDATGQPWRRLKVTARNLAGRVPQQLWVRAAKVLNTSGQEVGAPLDGTVVGGRYLIRVNDATREAAGFLPVHGNTVIIDKDHARLPGRDDVDGGSRETVSVKALTAKAGG